MVGKRKPDWKYWLAYGIVFAAMLLTIFFPFYRQRRAMIRTADGLDQYFYTLCYYGELIRSFFHGLFTEGKLTVPMWDVSIGYGSDILTTLNYYGVGDPLNLLCAFFDREHIEICFHLLFVIRLFAAGVLFSKLVRNHGSGRLASLTASMMYLFSGYTLYLVLQYWEFSMPLLCFPLVLLGIDRILEGKKPFLFQFGIFLCAVSNFYFFYMISIFMVFYAAYRYFGTKPKKKGRGSVSDAAGLLARFAGYYLSGLLLAMPVFLPILRVFLENGRRDVQYAVPLLYPLIQYVSVSVELFWGFGGSYLGYSFLLMPILVSVMLRRGKGSGKDRVVVLVMALFVIIPAFSSVFNGFSYVSERWYWFLAFVGAYLTAMNFDRLTSLRRLEKYIITAAFALLSGMLFVVADKIYAGAFLSGTVIVAALWAAERASGKLVRGLLAGSCMLGICAMSRESYLAEGGGKRKYPQLCRQGVSRAAV